jgi:hypothetical protein
MAFSEQDSAAVSSVGELPSAITSRNDDREILFYVGGFSFLRGVGMMFMLHRFVF